MHATTSSISACSIKGEPKTRKGRSEAGAFMLERFTLEWSPLYRGVALFRQPLQRRDLSVQASCQVHPPQCVDLFQRLFGFTIACVQRSEVDPIRGFAGISRHGPRQVNLRKLVVVQNVALEIRVSDVEARDRVGT